MILGPNHSSETKTSHPSNSANVTFLGWWVHVTRTQRLYKWPPTIGVQKVTLNHLDCVELFQINGTSKSISTDGPGMAVRAHVLLNQSLPVQKSNKKHFNSKGVYIIKYLYIYIYTVYMCIKYLSKRLAYDSFFNDILNQRLFANFVVCCMFVCQRPVGVGISWHNRLITNQSPRNHQQNTVDRFNWFFAVFQMVCKIIMPNKIGKKNTESIHFAPCRR